MNFQIIIIIQKHNWNFKYKNQIIACKFNKIEHIFEKSNIHTYLLP